MDVAVTPDEATERGGNRACLEEFEPSREAAGGGDEWFFATFGRAPVGIAHLALDGRFLRVNRRFCEIIGYSREEPESLFLLEISQLADRIQLQQVLLNLMRNALEAMRASGPGIPEDRLAGLFSAFSSTKPGGVGLGLAISRTIVEAHGGHIWAVRNPTVGTTFILTLPIQEKDENRDQPGDSLRGG